MGDNDWKSVAGVVVDRVTENLAASITTRSLSEKLTEFKIHPDNSDSTDITLIVSASDVVIGAGNGTQIELPALPESESRVTTILRSIADGKLTESIRGGMVTYQLELPDGSVLEGRTMKGVPLGRHQSVSYPAYQSK